MCVFCSNIRGIFFELMFGICCSVVSSQFSKLISEMTQFLSCLAGGMLRRETAKERAMCFASVDEFPSSS